MAKARRIRKAPTVKEQAQLAQAESDSKPKARSKIKGRLAFLGFLRPVLRPLRWVTPTYFVNSWRELRLVTWPNRRETWRLTLAVLIFAIVFGSLVAGVDKILDIIFKKFILHVG